jgi:hypothetical protein
MDEKISLDAIGAYGDTYADKVSKNFFGAKNRISGSEILSLSNVPQVNMFVIRELLITWREETQKLKSPYFDYENAEVKESLRHLMTVLSNHISVDKEHFVPLLRKAVRQTLLVIFNPYDFFSLLVTGKNNTLRVAEFREEIKYLKINREPLVRLLKKLEEKGSKELSGNEAFAILDQILEEVNFTPEDLEEHIRQFSSVVPLDPASFYPPKNAEPAQSHNNILKHNVTRETEKPKADVRHPAKESSMPTLNDRVNSDKRPAVYSNFQKISKIKDNLTINQKFMFTKVLFYGDFESFSRAIDDLDQLTDMPAALGYLETQSANWDRESKEFHEFMELVEKRFG